MRRAPLLLALIMSSGADVGASDTSTTPARILAFLFALGGAVGFARVLTWAWSDACRPLVDGYVLRALKRERVNFAGFIRDEILAVDMVESVERDNKLSALAVEAGRSTEALSRIERAVGKITDALGQFEREQGRLAGVLEEMQNREGKKSRSTDR